MQMSELSHRSFVFENQCAVINDATSTNLVKIGEVVKKSGRKNEKTYEQRKFMWIIFHGFDIKIKAIVDNGVTIRPVRDMILVENDCSPLAQVPLGTEY